MDLGPEPCRAPARTDCSRDFRAPRIRFLPFLERVRAALGFRRFGESDSLPPAAVFSRMADRAEEPTWRAHACARSGRRYGLRSGDSSLDDSKLLRDRRMGVRQIQFRYGTLARQQSRCKEDLFSRTASQ